MKNYNKKTRVALEKRIAFCIIIILLIQIVLPVMSNLNIASIIYASNEDYDTGNVLYKKIGNGYNAIIKNADAEEIVIKENVTNSEKVKQYEIRTASGVGSCFDVLKKLKKLTIPMSVLKSNSSLIKDYVFEGADSIEELTITGSDTIVAYNFDKLKNLKKLTIGDEIKEIGNSAFKDCKNLEKVYIAKDSNFTKIGVSAFENCKQLITFEFNGTSGINRTIKIIDNKAFYNCKNFSKIGLLTNVTQIGDYAFGNCEEFNFNLVNDISFTNIEKLGEGAFSNTGLREIRINGKITEIKNDTFKGCKKLYSVKFLNVINKIGDRAFSGCNTVYREYETLKKFEIPATVKYIGKDAFYQSRYTIYIGCSVIDIANSDAFKLNTEGGIICSNNSYAKNFFEKNKINITKSEDETYNFGGIYYKLSSVDGYKARVIKYSGTLGGNLMVPNIIQKIKSEPVYNVIAIDDDAFKGKKLDSIILPSGIQEIGKLAFAYNSNLKKVEIPKNIKLNNIKNNAFLGSNNVVIYCYKDSGAYKFAQKNNIKFKLKDNTSESSSTIKEKNNVYNSNSNSSKDTNNTTKQNNNSTILGIKINNNTNTTSPGFWDKVKDAVEKEKKSEDKTSPEVICNLDNGISKVKLSIEATDQGSGVRYSKLTKSSNESDGDYYDFGSGSKKRNFSYNIDSNGTYYLYIKDVKNNWTQYKLNVTSIDETSPEISKFEISEPNGTGKAVNVYWEAKDRGVGIKYWKISNKSGDWNGNYNEYDICYSLKGELKTISKNGTYYLYIMDNKKNAICKQFYIGSIDNTAPTVLKTEKIFGKGIVQINWTVYDSGVGVKGYRISNIADDWNGNYTIFAKVKEQQIISFQSAYTGTYYLYIMDDNGNKIRYTCTVTSDMIDKNSPEITGYTVTKDGTKKYLEFTAKDNTANDAGLYEYGIGRDANGADVKYYTYLSGDARKEVTKKFSLGSSGDYYIFVKDKAGRITTKGPISVDMATPFIKKFTTSYIGKGRYIDNTHYLSYGSSLNIRIVCNEAIKAYDKSKITVTNVVADKIEVKRVSGTLNEFNIKITANTALKDAKISIAEGFLKDNADNLSKKGEQLSKLKITVDNSAPTIQATYIDNVVTAKISDNTRVSKYQWKVVDDDKNVLWTGSLIGNTKALNVHELTRSLPLKRYKGRIVALYVEDIFGNNKTYYINPPISPSVEFVERNENVLTYRITMNLKSNLYNSFANNLQNYQTASNFKALDLKPEDSSGKKFLLRVDTKGVSAVEKIILPRGTIYVQAPTAEGEQEIEISVDNKAPNVSIAGNVTDKQQSVKLSFYFSESGSGLQKYEIVRLDNQGNIKKTIRTTTLKKNSATNTIYDYNSNVTLTLNGMIRITVWDENGNSKEAFIDVENIDRKAPKATSIEYSQPDDSGILDVRIVANEKITVKDNKKWTFINDNTIIAKYNVADLTGTGTKDTITMVDEAENETVVNIKDKISPKQTNITKMKIGDTNQVKVEITFNEELKTTTSLTDAGWTLQSNQLVLTKVLTKDEDIIVTDLAGNDTEVNVSIKDVPEQRLYYKRKMEPSKSTTPATQVIKYLYLREPILGVDLLNLTGKAEYELLENNTVVKLTYNRNVDKNYYIKFIISRDQNGNEYSERLRTLKVTNIVIKGDCNNNGTIEKEDVGVMYKHIWDNEKVEDEYKLFAMDINDDGKIDNEDYALLKNLI